MTVDKIKIVRDVNSLRDLVNGWRSDGLTVGLVPTMGALHLGHLSLVKKILNHCDRVVATIFINPKQFGAGEDLDRYPKDEQGDSEKLAANGAHAIFIPDGGDIYPDGFATNISVKGVSEGLCGAARPGHFDGVATIVTKLLIQAMPDVAIFGEKDFQQLAVINRLVTDLNLPIKIISGEIIREDDGLALSSRNEYLSDDERAIAPLLQQTLKAAADEALGGESLRDVEAKAKKALLDAGFNKVDYFSFCHSDSLVEADGLSQPTRLLVAAFLGKTRLIDNIAVN